MNKIREILELNPLVPVVTFHENDDPLAFMEFLLNQNVNCIEITLRTSSGLSAIERIKKEFDNVKVGAGTVINGDQIKILRDLGVDFIVSPGTTKKLIKEFINSEIPFINGVSTSSEVILSKELGLNTLKFFPAHLYGGIDALKMFGQLFSDVKFCPTGGINEQSSKEYLEQSNVIAVGGSWFQKEYNNLRK